MVKTRSSARVGTAAPSAPAENGTSSELRSRLKTTENGHRSQRPYNQTRNNQSLSSGSVGPGSGSQGKDPLAPALPGSRGLYQHPAVSGYNTQDSRGQNMPVSARQNPIYPSSMYHGYGGGGGGTLAPMPSPSPTAPLAPFPVHPDVKFRKLPFYDVLAELMKPSTMMPMQAGRMQEGTYVFHLTPQQATEIASGKDLVGTSNKLDYVIQAQLRFCLLETSCEQEDHFPPSVNVKVNNKMCPLPNPIPTNKPTPEPKRPPRPVNISSLVKLSPTVANTIQVTWAADFTRAYVLSVFMVRKLTSAELLQRLKNKGTKNPDYTRSLIKEKLSEDYDSEIATTSLRVSLMCPLGKMRMSCPCRPANCPHLQCFDASLFLQMNERKPTWLCPVCDRPAPYDSLVVDGYFQEVLTSSRLSSDCNEIQLHADGNWSAHAPPARAPQQAQPAAEPVTLISDDLEVIPVDSGVGAGKRAAVGEARAPRCADVMVDLTSDSDDDAPLKRKVPQPKPTPPASESSVKSDDNYSSSSAAEAVSSSGYRSPGVPGAACGVISLDSPSPPAPASPGTPAAPPGTPAPHHIVPHEAVSEGPHLSITPVTTAVSPHLIGSSTGAERDDGEATPAHWAPYADSDRDDNFRNKHQENVATASLREGANPMETGDDVVARQDLCLTPISTISPATSSAESELSVDFTTGLLNPVPISTEKVGEAPPAHANKITLSSCMEKTFSDLEKCLDTVESDDEVDVADVQTDGQTDMPLQHQLTPAHNFEDVETDLRTWLTNDDKDSDRLLTELIPIDYLTFDWVQDHNTFRGKRENFTGIAGPTFPMTDETTPIDIFLKFFDDMLIDMIIKQTNKNATRQIDQHLTPHSRLNFFVNVDRSEMARFLAILILQGLLPSPVEKSYWAENGYLTLKYFRDIMTYNRFVILKRLLQFSDSTDSRTLPTDDKKLRKIKPVLDLLQKKFSSLYLPRQEITVDESLLKWKGRLSFAQKIATKAARVGIKSYELCESDTGYLWRFFVYTGKTDKQSDKTDGLEVVLTDRRTDGPTDNPPLLTKATSKIVHDLVKPLYNRGHTLVMDNFYNSPLLARYLKSQGTDCFGTLRVNREFVPEAIKTIQKHELREGELVQSYTKDLSVVMWRDSNVVSLLSTYHDGVVGIAEKYGRFRYKPQVVLDYNRAMGGVDKKDQLLSAFPIERVRNIVWYKKVFRRLLNITLMNCHIIFQTRHNKCSPREFRRQVAESLIKISQPIAIAQPVTVETVKNALARKPKKVRPIIKGNHFICSGPCKLARCEWCKKSRTSYICKQCVVSLCLEICFEEYHTVPI